MQALEKFEATAAMLSAPALPVSMASDIQGGGACDSLEHSTALELGKALPLHGKVHQAVPQDRGILSADVMSTERDSHGELMMANKIFHAGAFSIATAKMLYYRVLRSH